MATEQETKRYRHNPLEVLIFTAITGFFIHSVYTLFQEKSHIATSFEVAETETTGGVTRSPASSQVSEIELDCVAGVEYQVSSERVKLRGMLCPPESMSLTGGREPSSETPARIKVVNQANEALGTVFMDSGHKKFTTDYLPLIAGENHLLVTYYYRGNRSSQRDLTIRRK